jgi:hypothetical protein
MNTVFVKKDLRPYSKSELAVLYNRSVPTLTKMLKPYEDDIGKKIGRYYKVNQVAIIFKKLNPPDCFLKDEYRPPENI